MAKRIEHERGIVSRTVRFAPPQFRVDALDEARVRDEQYDPLVAQRQRRTIPGEGIAKPTPALLDG